MTDQPFSKRQVAIRRLCLNARGELNPDARRVAAHLKFLCHGPATGRLVRFSPSGEVDPVATVAAAARREVWDELVKLLNLDPYQTTNLQDPDL